MNTRSLKIGHVHLKVQNLEHSIEFYTKILGLAIEQQVGRYVFLTYGNEHHDIALNEVGEEGKFPKEKDVGLYHFAIEVSSINELKVFYSRLQTANIQFEPIDHGISKALYFEDPDGNGIEVYIDTRKENNQFDWRGQSTTFDVDSL